MQQIVELSRCCNERITRHVCDDFFAELKESDLRHECWMLKHLARSGKVPGEEISRH